MVQQVPRKLPSLKKEEYAGQNQESRWPDLRSASENCKGYGTIRDEVCKEAWVDGGYDTEVCRMFYPRGRLPEKEAVTG